MVSFWPWKGDDNSPASFEKALSTLSEKIAQTTIRLDAQRSRGRRFKVLWTLYTTFAYILYSVILALVLGWRNWGIVEYTAIAGGPVVIYLVRLGLVSFFEYRISATESHLEDLQKQREATIEKLKAATKYNSTQQLLEKYGGSPAKSSPSKTPKGAKGTGSPAAANKKSPQTQPQGGRTGLPPPPTANIRRPEQHQQLQSLPSTPLRQINNGPGPGPSPLGPGGPSPPPYPSDPTSNFAPNAFAAAPQYAPDSTGPRWYDRLMDVLLGEDETSPKNRIALICQHCRLVNGQAPPDIKTVEDLGRWKCSACGGWNGEERIEKTVLKEINARRKEMPKRVEMKEVKMENEEDNDGWRPISRGDEAIPESGDEDDSAEEEQDEEETQRQVARRTRRSRPMQRVKAEESEEETEQGNVKVEKEEDDEEEEEEDNKPVTRSKAGKKSKGKK